MGLASDAVFNAVESTMQTFVNTAKKNGTWSKETAEEAFRAAKSTALLAMGVEAQKVVTEVAGDVSDASNNATLITDTNDNYYWYRS